MLPLGVIGPWQWVIIALVIVLLFGGKKIPELMHGRRAKARWKSFPCSPMPFPARCFPSV